MTKHKKKHILTVLILTLLILSVLVYFYLWAKQMGGGGRGTTLNAVTTEELNCSESDAQNQLEALLIQDSFKVSESDSAIVNWWKRQDYNLFNYVCINIQGRLYMVSLNSENSSESELGVYSYYNRSKDVWIYAANFSTSDKKEAKKAQEYLLKLMTFCKKMGWRLW